MVAIQGIAPWLRAYETPVFLLDDTAIEITNDDNDNVVYHI